ncbi:TPA: diacylglycerol kinase family protein [Candidatus Scatousia excrementigallinarum]|uniref:Diacylglycerol kinase family protein n=1 Tax=Candidatus Scatousia excrementigallinarum TaxID=2840935 RepID=A0A9D1JN80_9BACT|nr:diacylglycerol kinase family protein [Candidatus Scatousia excrementigallinarum]
MTKFKSQGFGNTFKNARKGMRIVLKSERNIRIHFIAAVFVLVLGFVLEFSALKISVLLLAIGLVVAAEMLNSAIEFSLDAIFHNRYSKMVGMAKDISAGAVMFVTIIAVIIGGLIFIPEIVALI